MKEKVVTLEEAAATVRDGALLGLTTSALDNPPMAFLREILRQGVKNLRVATLPGGGINVDLLLGAGAVAEYETCHCSLGPFGPAPNFQRAIRMRRLKMKDST
jgi:glutaconate CoA-transferase, subunit A